MAFFDFPAQHWQSIRTSNPIESVFATIRHRTKRSKGCLNRDGMLHIPLVTFLQNALPGSGCSSSDNALSKTGENYAALTTSPKSSQASRSKTELKPPKKARQPHDQKLSNTRFGNNSRNFANHVIAGFEPRLSFFLVVRVEKAFGFIEIVCMRCPVSAYQGRCEGAQNCKIQSSHR
jgi:hypothetical protein